MHTGNSSLACSRDRSGELADWAGVPLAGAYLKFLGGRCRPAIVRAAAWASADVAARARDERPGAGGASGTASGSYLGGSLLVWRVDRLAPKGP